jgi:aclacinomycin oxidase
VRVVVDMSLMTDVHFDAEMAVAVAVEAGATLGEVHKKLFLGWGMCIPLVRAPTSASAAT